MKGHRITWGVPIRSSGWQVLASSVREVTPLQISKLVALTDVGRLDEASTTEAFGYFGAVDLNDAPWAVFAHFYRSDTPMSTGQHFVQRDICLAPLRDFRAGGCDARPFLQNLPPKKFYDAVESSGPRWEIRDDVTASQPRLPTSTFEPDVLTQLLRVLLQPAPVILVWPEVTHEDLTDLLLYFPPIVRERMTFTTRSADPASPPHVQCVPRHLHHTGSSIVQLPRGTFVQVRTTEQTDLPENLVAAARAGTLRDLHRYIEDSITNRHAEVISLVRTATTAATRWRDREDLLANLHKPDRWKYAVRYLPHLIGTDGDADRRLFLTELIKTVEPPEQSDFADFVKRLNVQATEMPPFEETISERLATTETGRVQELVKLYEDAFRHRTSREALFTETLRRLPDDRRRIDDLAALEKTFSIRNTAVPEAEKIVLSTWTFRGAPQWDAVQRLFGFVTDEQRLRLLEANANLVTKLENDRAGRVALEAARVQYRGTRIDRLRGLASELPNETLDVVVEGPFKGWTPEQRLELLASAIASAVAARQMRHKDKAAELFVECFEHVDDPTILATEAVTGAQKWAETTSADRRKRIAHARIRHKAAAAEFEFRALLLKTARACADGSTSVQELMSVVGRSDRWSWYLAAAVHEDDAFNLSGFCDTLQRAREGVVLLHRIACAVLLAPRPRHDAANVLASCVAALVQTKPAVNAALRSQLAHDWAPLDHRELDRLLDLVTAIGGTADVSEIRRKAVLRLANDEPALAAAARLEDLTGRLSAFANGPELEVLTRRAGDFNTAPVEDAAAAWQVALDEAQLHKRLRSIGPRKGWFPR